MATVTHVDAEDRILLRNVDWQWYAALRSLEENNRVWMTYDAGVLELMSPSRTHERFAELLRRLVLAWTEEREIPMSSCGSTTLQKELLKKGLEPDGSFYVQNEALVREHDDLDLDVDPPPDLMIEVDITSPLVPKLPIYAALRVPEIWHWQNDSLHVLVLQEVGEYAEQNDSLALPGFPFCEAVSVIERRHTADENSLIRQFREWIRTHSE